MAFDWAWEKGKPTDEREFKILQSSPTMFWPELDQWRPVPHVGGRVRVCADGRSSSSSGTTSSSPSRRGRARRRCGIRTRATGVATSTTAASPAGCRSTTSTSATGACTSSTAATATACSPHRQPEHVQSDLLFCEPDESRAVACPISRRRRDVPPQQDAAHDARPTSTDAWRRDPDAAPSRGRRSTARATTTRGRST